MIKEACDLVRKLMFLIEEGKHNLGKEAQTFHQQTNLFTDWRAHIFHGSLQNGHVLVYYERCLGIITHKMAGNADNDPRDALRKDKINDVSSDSTERPRIIMLVFCIVNEWPPGGHVLSVE